MHRFERTRHLAARILGYEDYRSHSVVDEFGAADELDNTPERDDKGLQLMAAALEDLRARHLAFKSPEKCEECDLDELRLQVAMAATESEDLVDYYREAWGVKAGGPPAGSTPLSRYRRIGIMQIELMVRAYATLHLHRFANAPENRGWIVLFRQWGLSERFNEVFLELERTLPPEFVKFYNTYLRRVHTFTGTGQITPIHHPWLLHAGAQVAGRGLYMDSGIVEGEIEFSDRSTDPKSGEGPDVTSERPSDSKDPGGTPSAPNE